MKIGTDTFQNRKGWRIENDILSLFIMAGGGHIAEIKLLSGPDINPLWVPQWKTIEPWQYKLSDSKKYGVQLLSCISGHNLCLSAFGEPSPEEAKAGLGCHGEAPVARWRLVKKQVSAASASLTCACELPIAQMTFQRTITVKKGVCAVKIRETTNSTARKDQPFTICQHVTFGPPFLKQDVTVFDMNATKAQTFPGEFGTEQRLKKAAPFAWPYAPGARGRRLDIRKISKKNNSDFTTQLININSSHGWFSALNPELGLLVAYVWDRKDYPWVGNWEENFARAGNPWRGKSLARGMEFANTPFPTGLRAAVDMGKFQNQPAFSWLPAMGSFSSEYSILMKQVETKHKGVADIRPNAGNFDIDFLA